MGSSHGYVALHLTHRRNGHRWRVFINGKGHHGLGHPEMGHITVERVPGDDYAGHCPFHASCLEGRPPDRPSRTAGGPTLTDRPEVWELEATYLAQALRHSPT